jgi:uncharacterized protein with HEPN domain
LDNKALKFLLDVQRACAAIDEFCRGKSQEQFTSDELLRSAVERKMEIVGEAINQATKIEPDIAKSITTPLKIVALRNILAHHYWKVAPDILWDVAQVHVPFLKTQVDTILQAHPLPKTDVPPARINFDRSCFESAYASNQKPWDSGEVSAELKRVLDAGLLPGKTLLEIGCGTGTNAIELARRGYDVTAFDFVAQAVEAAREKAKAASVNIRFSVADALKDDLGGPYDVLFDRGVYHSLRQLDLKKFQQVLERITRKGSRWLTLAGNAKEQTKYGPPRVHEHEFRAELGGLFDFLDVREFRFGTDKEDFRPLGWAILMERK